ncbi:uncharacterized protein DFL_007146 [Arthrobotrys flagrans]|uniref:Uncharacterized protein n=1 Tax=Arthrobotrys flagrans TaxID=97331 RepID=A0A436ZUT8_ARTFL|nr:hypothetical protein DFL_007146 [Arthrobotrys flagrans]
MSNPHPHTTTYTPKTFLLVGNNYLEWSIHMERCIERFQWKYMLSKPYDAASFNDGGISGHKKRIDPYVLWKDIKNVWLPSATIVQYADKINNLKNGHAGAIEYAEARMYWGNYKEAGGKGIGEEEMVEHVLAGITGRNYEVMVGRLEDGGKEVDLNHVSKVLVKTEADIQARAMAKHERHALPQIST